MSSKAGIFAIALSLMTFNAAAAGATNIVRTSVAGELSYDTNVEAGSGEPVEDYIAVLAPRLEFVNENPNSLLNASYGFNLNSFLMDSVRNYVGHAADAGANVQLSETTSLQAAYNYRFTRDSREVTLTNIQTERSRTHSHQATLSATKVFSQNTSAGISAGVALFEYGLPALLDTRTDTAAVTVNYRFSDNLTVSPGYTFTNMHFDTGAEVISHSLRVGAAYRYSPTIDLNASAGAVYSSAGDDRTDWQAGAGLVKTLPRGSFSISYARGIANSAGLTDQLNVNDTFSAALSHSLTAGVNLGLSAYYTLNRTMPASTLDIRSYQGEVSANWQARQWLTLGASYSYFNQDSRDALGIDFERNILSFNFTIQPYEYRN